MLKQRSGRIPFTINQSGDMIRIEKLIVGTFLVEKGSFGMWIRFTYKEKHELPTYPQLSIKSTQMWISINL